jgi:small nuclear ribonucleoprotein (snRNP)-like protein
VGFLRAFDVHFNLLLTDVDEEYSVQKKDAKEHGITSSGEPPRTLKRYDFVNHLILYHAFSPTSVVDQALSSKSFQSNLRHLPQLLVRGGNVIFMSGYRKSCISYTTMRNKLRPPRSVAQARTQGSTGSSVHKYLLDGIKEKRTDPGSDFAEDLSKRRRVSRDSMIVTGDRSSGSSSSSISKSQCAIEDLPNTCSDQTAAMPDVVSLEPVGSSASSLKGIAPSSADRLSPRYRHDNSGSQRREAVRSETDNRSISSDQGRSSLHKHDFEHKAQRASPSRAEGERDSYHDRRESTIVKEGKRDSVAKSGSQEEGEEINYLDQDVKRELDRAVDSYIRSTGSIKTQGQRNRDDSTSKIRKDSVEENQRNDQSARKLQLGRDQTSDRRGLIDGHTFLRHERPCDINRLSRSDYRPGKSDDISRDKEEDRDRVVARDRDTDRERDRDRDRDAARDRDTDRDRDRDRDVARDRDTGRDRDRDRDRDAARDRDTDRERDRDRDRDVARERDRDRDRDVARDRERDTGRDRDRDVGRDRDRDRYKDSDRYKDRDKDSDKNRDRGRDRDRDRVDTVKD